MAVERFLERIEAAIPDDIAVYVVEEQTLQTVVGFGFYQGIMALGEREPFQKTETLIDKIGQTSSDVVPESFSGGAWVILPNTLKPDNLGLIFRSCAALGASGVILGEQCCDPFSRRALRVSMGGVLQVPIYKSDTLANDLLRLRDEAGFELCATVLADDAISLYDCAKWSKHMGFVFGHEFSGLSEPWLSCCTKKIMIPIVAGVDSLNLGVSVGVFLYEYNRARFTKGHGRNH